MNKSLMQNIMWVKMSLGMILVILISVPFLNSCDNQNKQMDLLSHVDPNIGSVHSRWFFYTPAAVPFGMAKLGPSTDGSYGNENGWEAVGYDDRHTSIEGFSSFREFQVGGVMLMPVSGKLLSVPGSLEQPDEGYRSRFKKEDEFAVPGYYRVYLSDYAVMAELTATSRVGFHRYTFPESDNSYVLFDVGNKLGESGEVIDASVEFSDRNVISGFVITEPEYVKKYQPGAEIKMFFYAIADKDPLTVGSFNGRAIYENINKATGKGAGLYLHYNTKRDEAVEIKIGLSYTSVENAKINLLSEAKDLNFEQAKKKAQTIWKKELGKIVVEGATEQDRIKFYTGLYHALLGRGLANDLNGAYPRNDGSVGQIPFDENGTLQYNFYNTDALWGAYWNLTQLWTLGWRDYLNDLIQSHLTVYKDGGWLGDGLANSKYVSGVGTNMVGLVKSAAYLNGIRNYDIELAYKAALKNEIGWQDRLAGAGKMDLRPFIEKGYIPYIDSWSNSDEGSGYSVSHSLEYSFSSYAVAQFAKELGKTEDYEMLMKLSENWKNYFDEETKLLRPLTSDGEFMENFDPLAPWVGFQEGNAYQYTFYVPHTPTELIKIIGIDRFNSRLDSIFEVSKQSNFAGGTEIDAFSGLKNLYNHGNQPSLHISWLFNFSGKPWLTQKWTREIMNGFYGTDGMLGYGVGQDEDQGQLGAWYVMSSMGLFDVGGMTNSNTYMQLGSPVFEKISITLDPSLNSLEPQLIINAKNSSSESFYVQSCIFNNVPVNSSFIRLQDLLKGGELNFEMGSSPNYEWGGMYSEVEAEQ